MKQGLLRKAIRPTPALEDIADGIARVEKEIEYYGRVTDLSQLAKAASVEFQEQWQVIIPKSDKNAAEGRMRVRRTTKGSEVEYVQTTKTKKGDDRIETSIPSSAAGFTQFKVFADQGMRKHRYSFPVGNGLVYEVDMFLKSGTSDEDKQYHEWCKIDLELNGEHPTIPAIPIFIEDLITDVGKSLDQELRDKITQLYDECFLTKNPFLNA